MAPSGCCVSRLRSPELRKPPVFTVGCEQTCHLCPGRRHCLYHTGRQRDPPLALEEILAVCSKAVHDTNLLDEMIWNKSSPDRHKPVEDCLPASSYGPLADCTPAALSLEKPRAPPSSALGWLFPSYGTCFLQTLPGLLLSSHRLLLTCHLLRETF